MDLFKIQLVKQQHPAPNQAQTKILPKLNIGIQSIVCLNYPIQTLSQIIASHFDEQPCPANIVTKALKIISISLKDKQLRKNIQNILSQNLHKRQHIYNLIVYWSTICNNLLSILTKIQQKLIQNVISCVISYYYFTSCKQNKNISRLITQIFTQLPQQYIQKIIQYIKNQYISMNYPIQLYIYSIDKLYTSNPTQKNHQNQLSKCLQKSKQSQINIQYTIRKYFQDTQLRQKINRYFEYFTQLVYIFINNLAIILDYTQILQIWESCHQYKMQSQIRTAIKQWLRMQTNTGHNNINSRRNYWKVFERNFNLSKNIEKYKRLIKLLQIGYQLDQTNIVSQFVIQQYLYNYFADLDLKVDVDNKILQKITQNKQNNKYHFVLQTMGDYIKSFSNLLSKDNIKILTINKIYAPIHWNKTTIQIIKSYKYTILLPYISKLVSMVQDLQNRNKQKGKKIQLVFHGIQIVFKDDNRKKIVLVGFQQLINILKGGDLPNVSILQDWYKAFEEEKKIQVKKDIQSIVIQAKIVRMLKKRKQKMNFKQICQQILKQLGGNQQNCRASLDKVISKGLAAQQGQNYYIYCA